MFFTTKRKLMADNEMLRAKIRSLEQQLSTANVILATQKRELQRNEKEIEALSQTIDGMEQDLNNKKRYIKVSDQQRKQVSQREREVRVKYEKLAEDIRRIGRDGLCCLCAVGASPEACGCTCCFEYDGELPDKNRNRSDGPSGTPAPTKAQDNIDPKNSTERYVKILGELTTDDLRKECPMRHKNGTCSVIGGFCTAVNHPTCLGVHNAYELGKYDAAIRIKQEQSQYVNV